MQHPLHCHTQIDFTKPFVNNRLTDANASCLAFCSMPSTDRKTKHEKVY